MPRILAGSVQQPFEARRGDVSRAQSVEVQLTRISGTILVEGAGEITVPVSFPVWFVERPGFSFGGELSDNHWPAEGNFPTISVVVTKWDINERSTYGRFYRGADLAIVTEGQNDQQMWVHWHVEAKAFMNPIDQGDSVDGTI